MAIRRLIFSLQFLLLFSFSAFSQQPEKVRTEEVRGTVVAEYYWIIGQSCYHVCGLRLVVRLDKPQNEYVVVAVEYMDDRSSPNGGKPVELVIKAARWKFKGSPDAKGSSPLEGNIRTIDQSIGRDTAPDTRIAAWRLLPGAEKEVLPFGKSIDKYVVRVGKFKSID